MFAETESGVAIPDETMNLRNLVDAIRRKPTTEAPPLRDMSEPPPPVEVADIVAGADAPPPAWNQAPSALMQSLLNGFSTSGGHRITVEPADGAFTDDASANGASERTASFVDASSVAPASSAVTFPSPDDSWFETSIPTAPLTSRVIPLPPNELFPSFPSPPVNADPPAVADVDVLETEEPPAPAALISPKRINEFLHALNQTESVPDALDGLARAAVDALQALRAFIVRFDERQSPLPIDTEYAAPTVRHSLRGITLAADLVDRLKECVKASASSLIEIPSGLSPLPLQHAAGVEWYVAPSDLPGEAVVGLQWAAEPPPDAREWAVCLAQCVKLAVARLRAARPTPVPAEPVVSPPALDLPSPVAESVLGKLNEGVVVLDDAGVVRYVNPVAEFMLGCPSVHFLGADFYSVGRRYSPENAAIWDHLAASPQEQQFSIDFWLPDGNAVSTVFVALALPAPETSAPTDWTGGRIIVIRDVTFIRAEAAKAAEDAALARSSPSGAFAPGLPPDGVANLRTSLQMVLGFSELLHRGEYGAMNPQQFEMFRNIEHHARRMADLLGMPPAS
jgi:PAS domain-containing protein